MSSSLAVAWVTALIAFLISSADSGAEEKASSPAMSVISPSVRRVPSKASSGT